MEALVVGFVIAVAIGLTGVGGGTIATPLLIFVLRMKVAPAVGTALTFAAIIKLLVAPLYISRKQVDYRVLGWMLLGGVPGVIIGGRVLIAASHTLDQRMLYLILGITILIAALLNIYRLLRRPSPNAERNRFGWLGASMFPVGLEMGFSSAGSGALGGLALLGLTKLDGAAVVGTGICFGLVLSVIGSGLQMFAGNFDIKILEQLLFGGLLGAAAGGILANKIPSRPLKWGMAVWLGGLGLQLLVRGMAA